MPTSVHYPMAPQPATTAPHFAGGGSVLQRMGNKTIKLFDAINREYLYEFLLLDIVALWVTRIVTGLIVGRIAVNTLLQPNPASNADTPFQLWRHDLGANIKGLNWGNAAEILKREALTGPGLIVIPSFMYAATRALTRNHTQEMHYGWFQKFHLAFQAGVHSMDSAKDAQPIQELVKSTVRQFFSPMAQDDALATLRNLPLTDATMLRQMPRSHIQLKVPDNRTLGDVLRPYGTSHSTTMGEFLEAWVHRYANKVETIIHQHGGDRSKARKALQELASTLGEDLDAVWRGVTRHNGNALTHVAREGLMPLRELHASVPLFKQQSSLAVEAVIDKKWVSIEAFTKNLGHFSDYWLDVLPKATTNKASQLLSNASAYANKLTRIKGLTTLTGMIIGGTWLYFLPRFTQSGKSYPAARLFQQTGLNATGVNASDSAIDLNRLSANPALNPLWRLNPSRSSQTLLHSRGGVTV